MTTTVRQLIEFLQTQDQDAIVQILVGEQAQYGCDGDSYFRSDLAVDQHVEYTDFRGNQFTRPTDAHYNQRYLFLGSD